MDETPSIDCFNRCALGARARMYQRVLDLARPDATTRILDAGTSPDPRLPYNNFFERWYPHPGSLAAYRAGDCSNLEAHFPGLTEGQRLPFRDGEFDLVVSFTVLEQVGSEARQGRFLAELARVASSFVYAPYRRFPIEMHTLLPFTHWLPAWWHRALWRQMGLSFWADERNLNLPSIRVARRLVRPFGRASIRLLWTCGWPSNLEIHWRRKYA